MRLAAIRDSYPQAARMIRRMVDDGRAILVDAEGLSHQALDRIERGNTPEPDLVRLLQARGAIRRRQR